MPARFQAVAWDIDGTLVDSEPLHHRALVEPRWNSAPICATCRDMAFRGIHMGESGSFCATGCRARLPKRPGPTRSTDTMSPAAARCSPCPARSKPSGAATAGRAAGLRIQFCRLVVDANLDALDVGACMEFSISLERCDGGQAPTVPMPARRCGSDLRRKRSWR